VSIGHNNSLLVEGLGQRPHALHEVMLDGFRRALDVPFEVFVFFGKPHSEDGGAAGPTTSLGDRYKPTFP
jgi:hypothetical protein